MRQRRWEIAGISIGVAGLAIAVLPWLLDKLNMTPPHLVLVALFVLALVMVLSGVGLALVAFLWPIISPRIKDASANEPFSRLCEHTVIYGENNTVDIAHVFALIGDRLPQGLRAGHWSVKIFDDVIGKGWSGEAIEEVFKWLLLEGLVSSQYVEPAKANAQGLYDSIHAMPYTVYRLTEQGRLAYQWLLKTRKPRK